MSRSFILYNQSLSVLNFSVLNNKSMEFDEVSIDSEVTFFFGFVFVFGLTIQK